MRLVDLILVRFVSLKHTARLVRIVIDARLNTLEFFHFPVGFLVFILLAYPLHFLLVVVLLLPDGDLIFLGEVLVVLSADLSAGVPLKHERHLARVLMMILPEHFI